MEDHSAKFADPVQVVAPVREMTIEDIAREYVGAFTDTRYRWTDEGEKRTGNWHLLLVQRVRRDEC